MQFTDFSHLLSTVVTASKIRSSAIAKGTHDALSVEILSTAAQLYENTF